MQRGEKLKSAFMGKSTHQLALIYAKREDLPFRTALTLCRIGVDVARRSTHAGKSREDVAREVLRNERENRY